jgi:hypothetical protein
MKAVCFIYRYGPLSEIKEGSGELQDGLIAEPHLAVNW